MIKVECVSCKSPYEVDERRVPDTGMKMRCPKCSTSFLVNKDGSTTAQPQAGAIAPPPPVAASGARGPIAPPPASMMSKTLVGQRAPTPPAFEAPGAPPAAPPAPPPSAAARSALKGTMVGIPPGAAPPPRPMARDERAGAEEQPQPDRESDGTDLPALKPPPKPAVPWGSLAPPAMDAKPPMSRPVSPGSLPKGALGGPQSPPPTAQSPSARGGAASAFGAPSAATPAASPKRTLMGTPNPDVSLTDLPALKSTQDAAGFVDLPAPKISGRAELDFSLGGVDDLPALEVDLPAPKAPRKQAVDSGVDLPAPKLEVDLPAPKRAPQPTMMGSGAASFGEIDLPAPKQIADLPAPRAQITDLPAPRGVADLPIARGMTDLPTPKIGGAFGELDLPMPKPPPGPGMDEASFGDLDLPDLPPLPDKKPGRAAGFGDIELPSPRANADIIPPKAPTVQGGHRAAPLSDESSFGDLNPGSDSLPPSLMGADDESSFGDVNADDEVPAPPSYGAANSMPPALFGEDDDEDEDASALGSDDLVSEGDDEVDSDALEEDGEDYGEAGLPDGEGDSEEDMEFGMADGEDVALPPEMLRRQRGEDTEEDQAAKSKRTIHVVVAVAVVLLVLGGAGAALSLTNYGLFGVYYLERFMQGAGDPQFVQGAIARAEKTASSDTFRDVRRSLSELGLARNQAGLNRELLTRSLLHESLFLMRFGAETNSASHAAAIILRLQERHNVAPGIDLALAADAARRQAWGEVEPLLTAARTQSVNDPYVDLIAGEAAIRQGKLADAEKAFGRALKNRGGARAQWGLARVAIAKNDEKAAQAAIESTLQLSPLHVEARIAQARILWAQGKEDRSMTALRQALGLESVDEQFLWTSKPALAQGYAVLGFIHESRGRLHLAQKAYDDSLAADPYMIDALLGAGRVMLRRGLYSDALPRFDTALNIALKSANPVVLGGRKADVEARLGQGRAQLAMTRIPEAKGVLSVLMNENPNDPEILLAVGRAEEELKNKDSAESLFKKSIDLAPTSFAGYLALSQFYFKQNQADKASDTLNLAATKVEESAEMRRMLGQSELVRNRLDSAVHEYKRAVELDPQDLDAKFGLAVALRKTGALDAARALFDEIGKRDPQFANLTLERGQLFEAQGDYAKATESYKQALEKDPSDTNLMLRLGAAQVEGNLLDDAEQTLQKVIHDTPNSSEAEYFIGRVAFGRGRGPDALTHFDRALSLDATVAVYHLYAARAAFALQNLGRTNEEVQLALTRDPALGDAYWVRGEVRLRAGLVKDALKDLQHGLQLKPDRYEIYAAMADCYDQLRQLPQSVEMWHTALQKDPKNGEWWSKLGRQYLDMGNSGNANEALQKAMALGDAQDPIPYWLPEVYRLTGEIARLGNNKKTAITYYKRYLEIAPEGAPDREEVRKILKSWEVELGDE